MISIPSPCNEDFNKMTPTERGAFCAKCKIDTYDFRKMSNAAVNKILLNSKGKHICGQFKTAQLNQLNREFVQWKSNRKKTFRSKFLFALILVFGIGLFSCANESDRQIIESFTIQLAKGPSERPQYINSIHDREEFDLIDFVDIPVLGKTELAGEVECIAEESELLGDTVILTESLIGPSELGGVPQMILSGALVVEQPTYMAYLEDTLKEEPNTEEPIMEIDLKVFPNPVESITNVVFEIVNRGYYQVQVYDMNGRQIQTLFEGMLDSGEHNFELDLSENESGLYLVRVISSYSEQTIKVQKVNQ
ncbi:T9SS type A sorting domain-containing protein [Crocinitomix algicola]|uniref:T9SS type A sorting domain-containing protein n=1 Tax=Crocinitomix algicola TaxID=1740263 RepID=UPI000834BA3A|nr:T9SS type A sorting domain-containing protein [Crocinitomix algicola]